MEDNNVENPSCKVESSHEELKKTNYHPRNKFGGKRYNKWKVMENRENGQNMADNESNFGQNPSEDNERNHMFPYNKIDRIEEKISIMSNNPTLDLPSIDSLEKKFSGRNRLYIANIGNEIAEEDLKGFFKPFGEISEVFINNEKNFAFATFDYHANAEKAQRELDGTILKSRNLKIKFAPSSATIKVRNLSPCVTNELLYYAFSVFGDIEKVVVLVDEKGRSTGDAVIDPSLSHYRDRETFSGSYHGSDSYDYYSWNVAPIDKGLWVREDIRGFQPKKRRF